MEMGAGPQGVASIIHDLRPTYEARKLARYYEEVLSLVIARRHTRGNHDGVEDPKPIGLLELFWGEVPVRGNDPLAL